VSLAARRSPRRPRPRLQCGQARRSRTKFRVPRPTAGWLQGSGDRAWLDSQPRTLGPSGAVFPRPSPFASQPALPANAARRPGDGPAVRLRCSGARQGARRPRQRRCLLKGCERPFRPTHPQARYCSPECRAAARRWRRRRAARQYRQTTNGQEKRRDQCRRNRCRCAERRRAASAQAVDSPGPDPASSPCEGQRAADESEFFSCDRPGCEDHFVPSRRSPCQRFCSSACRQALRRVIERERRWRQRAQRVRSTPTANRCRGP
jgi:hypothetical protein